MPGLLFRIGGACKTRDFGIG